MKVEELTKISQQFRLATWFRRLSGRQLLSLGAHFSEYLLAGWYRFSFSRSVVSAVLKVRDLSNLHLLYICLRILLLPQQDISALFSGFNPTFNSPLCVLCETFTLFPFFIEELLVYCREGCLRPFPAVPVRCLPELLFTPLASMLHHLNSVTSKKKNDNHHNHGRYKYVFVMCSVDVRRH